MSTRTLSDSGSSEDSKIPNHHNDTLEAQKSYADGDILLRNSQYTEALAEFERAVALAPSWTEAWIQKGAALSHLQRNVDALDAYDRALVLNPNSALAWAGKAIVLKNLGRSDEAGFAARCAQLGSIIERRRGEAR
ncbi:MAG: tetratricopeptide repeat protein [Ktedonobacterales bacterium]